MLRSWKFVQDFSLGNSAINGCAKSEIRVGSSLPPARFKGCRLLGVKQKYHIVVGVPVSQGVSVWVGVCIALVCVTAVEITGKNGICRDDRKFGDVQYC